MTAEVYFLSLLDGINGTCMGLFALAAVAAAICLIFGVLEMLDGTNEVSSRLLSMGYKSLMIAGLVAVIASFVPTTNSLMRAYLMVEGSKVINAENAEEAVSDLSDKIKRLIDAVDPKEETDE